MDLWKLTIEAWIWLAIGCSSASGGTITEASFGPAIGAVTDPVEATSWRADAAVPKAGDTSATLFSSLNRGPGTHYLVLMPRGSAAPGGWQVQSPALWLVGPLPSAPFANLSSYPELGFDNGDVFWNTEEPVSEVPEPVTFFLFGPALILIAAARKCG